MGRGGGRSPPCCSLVFHGKAMRRRPCVRARACARRDRSVAGNKGPPPYLVLCTPLPPNPNPTYPPTVSTSRLCLSKLDFILQRQSGMNNSFCPPSPAPFFFFFLFFLPVPSLLTLSDTPPYAHPHPLLFSLLHSGQSLLYAFLRLFSFLVDFYPRSPGGVALVWPTDPLCF